MIQFLETHFPLNAPIPTIPPDLLDGEVPGNDLILLPFDLGDFILGKKGNDTIAGSLGDDTIRSGPGGDLVYGGDPPRLLGVNLEETFTLPLPIPGPFPLDDGNDRIFAGAGNDTVYGGSGADTIRGGIGNDIIMGGSPGLKFPIPLFGHELPTDLGPRPPLIDDLGDELRSGAGNDTVTGGSGADTVFGGAGDDSVMGGIGADGLNGNTGNDTIDGGTGDDTIRGGFGNDVLTGGLGDDHVIGGQGDDTLTGVDASTENPGQLARDTFTGGLGQDRFILGDANTIFYDDSQVQFIQPPPANEPPPSYGLITDFQLGLDVIQLNGSVSYALRAVELSGDAFGLGIYFDADRQEVTGAEQLIGIIQSDDDLTGLTRQTSDSITELR